MEPQIMFTPLDTYRYEILDIGDILNDMVTFITVELVDGRDIDLPELAGLKYIYLEGKYYRVNKVVTTMNERLKYTSKAERIYKIRYTVEELSKYEREKLQQH